MYGAIFALLIAVSMILITALAAYRQKVYTVYCRKSEVTALLDDIADDCVIQILIGRNSYEHKRHSDP